MSKRVLLTAVTLLLMVALSAVPGAASSPPLDVEFAVPTTLPDEGPSFGPFTATGPAVDAGLVCASGDTIDVFGKVSGSQSPRGFNIQLIKLFTCDDGSGEFFVKLQVRIDKKGTNFNWNILGGTGDYEKLHGTGKGVGLLQGGDPVIILDIYSGAIHSN